MFGPFSPVVIICYSSVIHLLFICYSFVSFRLWTNMTDKEFKILESTLCADIAETESQVSVEQN